MWCEYRDSFKRPVGTITPEEIATIKRRIYQWSWITYNFGLQLITLLSEKNIPTRDSKDLLIQALRLSEERDKKLITEIELLFSWTEWKKLSISEKVSAGLWFYLNSTSELRLGDVQNAIRYILLRDISWIPITKTTSYLLWHRQKWNSSK